MKKRTARLALVLVLVSLTLTLAGSGSAHAVKACSPDVVNNQNGGWPVCVYVIDNRGVHGNSWTGVGVAQFGEVLLHCDQLGSQGRFTLIYGIGVLGGGSQELPWVPPPAGYYACFSA